MPNILLEDVLKANKKPLREAKQLDTNAPEYEGLSNSEIVEKATGLDMFEQREAILNALNKRFDASNLVEIETMNVEAVEVQEDGTLKVTYDIYGRPIALYEKVAVTLPVMDSSKLQSESKDEDLIDSEVMVESAKDADTSNVEEILNALNVLRNAGYDVDKLTAPDDVISAFLKRNLSQPLPLEEMKELIYTVYGKDITGYVLNHIEDFVTRNGVPEDSSDILEGLSEELVKTLYSQLYQVISNAYEGMFDKMDYEMAEALEITHLLP